MIARLLPLPPETGDTGYTRDSPGQGRDFTHLLGSPCVPGFSRDRGQEPGTVAARGP